MSNTVKILLALLVLGIIAGLVTSAAQAAGQKTVAAQTTPATAFDPFTLTTYAVPSQSAPTSAQTLGQIVVRRPIRIPFRPQLRSPFRPQW